MGLASKDAVCYLLARKPRGADSIVYIPYTNPGFACPRARIAAVSEIVVDWTRFVTCDLFRRRLVSISF